jgi:hypothetical protein
MAKSAKANDGELKMQQAAQIADELIAKEIAGQDKMWGGSNERADSTQGQLLNASLAQALAVRERRMGNLGVFDSGTPVFPYPEDWSGFRSYGGDVANLVVAAAFLRQEIKRLVAAGADTTRLSRDQAKQPYAPKDQPYEPFPVV